MAEYRFENDESGLHDELEQRLNALGRAVLTAEASRATPPRNYLHAAGRRAMFARTRVWTARLAIAAAVVIAGVTAVILLRPNAGPAVSPIAVTDPPAPHAAPDEHAPTLRELTALNRDMASPEGLRLPASDPGPRTTDASLGSPMRASDSRRAEKIDAILSGR